MNFAMHPDTCGGSKISADWPGALSRVLAGYHGTNHITLVGNGVCGNLNHFDTSWSWSQGTAIEQHRIATVLGASIFQAYKNLAPVTSGSLRTRSEIVELGLPEITPAQVQEARKVVFETKTDSGSNFNPKVPVARPVPAKSSWKRR